MNAITQTRAPVLTPTTFEQLVTFADIAAASEFVPKDFRGRPGNIMLAVQMGSELGLSPMQSLQSIAVINGRPGVWGDGLIGLCRQSPLCEDIIERIDGEGDAREAVCIAKRRGSAPVEGRFSVSDAKRAQLWGKDIWAKYPDRMLRSRARSYALRDAFPDVLRGLKMGEELIDTPADDWRGPTIDASPETITKPAPDSSPPQQPLQAAKRDYEAEKPKPRLTQAQFLDGLDSELRLAPDADAVQALLTSSRVASATEHFTGDAAERLAGWIARAHARQQALRDDAAEVAVPAMDSTDDWPLADDVMAQA